MSASTGHHPIDSMTPTKRKPPPGPPPHPSLEDYRRKRDPGRTPEPFGGSDEHREPVPAPPPPAAQGVDAAARSGKEPRFVVQQHWARSMHFDLRLELDGTLKSWAVPKGPSTRAEEKRLAVHVEDHPLEYADFEGVIPSGNYGAGSVIVWDRGWFRSFKPEHPLEQYERGRLELELFGFKLRGRWTLVRMGKKEKEWLLLKKVDGAASEIEAIDRYPESVISGLTVEEMRDAPGTLAATRERVESLKAPKGDLDARSVPLMLATLEKRPPSGRDWCFEIKYDGVRVLASREDDDVQLVSRSGEDITTRYPEITAAVRSLATPRFLIDGEIIAEDEHGRPSFERLQSRMHLTRPRDIEAVMARIPARGMFFDCLGLAGHDLRGLPLVQRKELLGRVLPPLGTVQRCGHLLEQGDAFFAAASEMGLEGIVAKRLTSPYTGRRSPDWIKIKCDRREMFVIGGYTKPQGARAHFGALHVGQYRGGQLVYVTKVGTGFDAAGLAAIAQALAPLARATSPFTDGTPGGRGHFWVEPRLVCEIRFTEWTNDGGLRHPTFLGLRPDVRPEDCRRDRPSAAGPRETARSSARDESGGADDSIASDSDSRVPAATAPAVGGAMRARAVAAGHDVRITNPKKVFWPDGYTKGDLIAYYEKVAPLLLPYLRDRPVVLTRYPDGIAGKSFFQKDAPVYVPDWVRTESIHSDDTERDIRYFVIDDLDSLRYVANLGTIPLHVWGARVSSLENPDWLVLDLDPKEAPFAHVVQVARALKTILDELELPAYVKTSGKTGLHVLIPMGRLYTHEQTRTFARLIAMLTVDTVPEISTVARAIKGRGGKVYVDFGQNGHGITIVAPYAVRPLPGAPASCPLRWDEVNARLDPAHFTIRTIPERFAKMADPMSAVLGEGIDMGSAIATIARRMKRAGESGDGKRGRKP
jgi:bifunctional non-homologous end joining protein LigD